VGDSELLDGHDGKAHVRLLVLLVDTKEYASHVLLELHVEEKELEREEGEPLDQPIDMGELDALGEAMMLL
jgi:hypothetical protein